MREIVAERDGRVLRLLDDQPRFGRWDSAYECWVSTIDPNVELRPVAFAPMPGDG